MSPPILPNTQNPLLPELLQCVQELPESTPGEEASPPSSELQSQTMAYPNLRPTTADAVNAHKTMTRPMSPAVLLKRRNEKQERDSLKTLGLSLLQSALMIDTRASATGAAFAAGVGLGIGIDHLVGAVRDDGRTLSASIADVCDRDTSESAKEPRPNERGEFTKGWRFIRDDVPDEDRVRSVRFVILWEKLLTRLKELDICGEDRPCEYSFGEYGIRISRIDPEHGPFHLKDLNDLNEKQRDFLRGEGNDIVLKMYQLAGKHKEDELRRKHASTP